MVFRRRMEKALNQLERMVLPHPGVNVGTVLYGCALLNSPAGRSEVHAPHDETCRGAAGNLRPFRENTHRKHRLFRFNA